MDDKLIKVGFLVSYDYELLKISIPRVYEAADSITLAIDIKRRTWMGAIISIPQSFFEWIKQVDYKNKIVIYEDDFYVKELSTKENDTRERNMLGMHMGEGGWHIQVDSDEYFVDFGAFCEQLQRVNSSKPISVFTLLVTLFKKLDGSYLYISGNKNYFPVATNHPHYDAYRLNNAIDKKYMDHLIIHDSWARSEKDIWFKLSNWSHNRDFDIKSYYDLWRAANSGNYKHINYFHPFIYDEWRHLSEVKCSSIEELVQHLTIDRINAEYEDDIMLAAKQPLLQIIKKKIKNKFHQR